MNDLQYGKVITTQTYYNGLVTHVKEEKEVSVLSSRDELLRDIIDSLTVVSSGETTKLTLEIMVDPKGKYRIVRRWG